MKKKTIVVGWKVGKSQRLKVLEDYVAAKMRGVPVMGVKNCCCCPVWKSTFGGNKKVRKCCSTAKGMYGAMVIVAVVVKV